MRLRLRWSTVVGTFLDTKDLRVIRNGDRWEPLWPLVKEPRVPPQVIAVNYLRWDVIYRGPEDDWGAQDVEAPHVRIVDMHPVERGDGVILMGELLNEDVVPAYVSVKATLLAKNGTRPSRPRTASTRFLIFSCLSKSRRFSFRFITWRYLR